MIDETALSVVAFSDAPHSIKMVHYHSSQSPIPAGQGAEKAAVLHDGIPTAIESVAVDPLIAELGGIY